MAFSYGNLSSVVRLLRPCLSPIYRRGDSSPVQGRERDKVMRERGRWCGVDDIELFASWMEHGKQDGVA